MLRSLVKKSLTVLLLTHGAAYAQQTSINGKVTDASGAVIAGAGVTAQIAGGSRYHTVERNCGE